MAAADRSWRQSESADAQEDQAKRRTFIETLNERLPTKRVIAQGVLRNERDEVLLCQLTYKQEWDLPGGVVDQFESPATCLARECREELGAELTPGPLLATSWLPPYRGWDDAVAFIFDLGRVDSDWSLGLTLQPREIIAVHWVDSAVLDAHAAPYAARLIRAAVDPGSPRYLENGAAPSR